MAIGTVYIAIIDYVIRVLFLCAAMAVPAAALQRKAALVEEKKPALTEEKKSATWRGDSRPPVQSLIDVGTLRLEKRTAAFVGEDDFVIPRNYSSSPVRSIEDTGTLPLQRKHALVDGMEPAILRDAGPALARSKVDADLPAGEITPVRVHDPDPRRPLRETHVIMFMLIGLSLMVYGASRGGRPYGKSGKAVIKCPRCGKKLGVPDEGKRIRVRCPECGMESAYNPEKKG